MNQNSKYAVGIGVPMDDFHVCFSVIDALQKVTIMASRSFTNNSKGFQTLAIWVKSHHKEVSLSAVYAMEITGIHSLGLLRKLGLVSPPFRSSSKCYLTQKSQILSGDEPL